VHHFFLQRGAQCQHNGTAANDDQTRVDDAQGKGSIAEVVALEPYRKSPGK